MDMNLSFPDGILRKYSSQIHVGESVFKNSLCENSLSVKIDKKLNFDSHVKSLCKKSYSKLTL